MLDECNKARAVESLMRSFVRMEKQVEKHPIEPTNSTGNEFGHQNGLCPAFRKGEPERAHLELLKLARD
ncbi:hypothetical protein HRbin30_03204 [bacterium HR30]|nr:hypothetical protein HRbin30_03204 [bacterium HR30]